jgi:diaminopimelate epimerase
VAPALAVDLGEGVKEGSVFYKMSGSGNDFAIFDGRYARLEDFTAESIREICDRRQGAGADGVIVLTPGGLHDAHFTFHFWNSDGSVGPMCGNGALCSIRLASLIELAPLDADIRFATPAGIHGGRVSGNRPQIALPDCDGPKALDRAAVEPGERHPMLVTPSVPHLVVLVDDVDQVDLDRRGPPLRSDPAIGPGGANANFVSPAGDGTFRMRTWERGVEGETLACGTGAVACAIVLEQLGMAKAPVRIWTRSGLPLDIGFFRTANKLTHITLAGEGRLVFRGIVGESQTTKR